MRYYTCCGYIVLLVFVLNTENLLFFFCSNNQIYPVLIKIPLFWVAFLKNLTQTQENIFQNFFFKVATELELISPKISL